MRIYFAHPISLYNTPEERAMIDFISGKLGCDLVNPSAPEHQATVERIRGEHHARSASSSAIMDYFVDVCRTCDAVVFAPFPDGTLGAGVLIEVKSFLDRGKPAFVIESGEAQSWRLRTVTSLDGYKTLSPTETRAMLGKLKTPGYQV